MKKISLYLITFFAALAVNAQSTVWNYDASHSKVRFAVDHMVISEVEGKFDTYSGSVKADKADFSDAKVEFKIDVKSIDTDNQKRDEHLLAPDFFDAEKFPNITFKSTSFKKVSEGKYKMTGDFTMHGVTKSLTFDVSYGGTVKDPWGNTKAGFKITGVINRLDFGMAYNSTLEAGGIMIGEEVRISCSIELAKAK